MKNRHLTALVCMIAGCALPVRFLAQCSNLAGTFTIDSISGRAAAPGPGAIYLCLGDTLFVHHNGDYNLDGDPNPATAPGIIWAIYSCPAMIGGPNLPTILNDPCLLPGSPNGIWALNGQQNGDLALTNNGTLQVQFNNGQPLKLFFNPMTVDDFAAQAFESQMPGLPPGPCVNVTTDTALQVVFLNEISLSNFVSGFAGDDCLGKFRIRGGYPEWNSSARYQVDIRLETDTTVQALINSNPLFFSNGSDVIFSTPQAGVYRVRVWDGKGCKLEFLADMGSCNASDNIGIDLPDTIAVVQGSDICFPVVVTNCTTTAFSFSVQWDPTLFQYAGYQALNPQLMGINSSFIVNNAQMQGLLGFDYFNALGEDAQIPDGGSLFTLCFHVIGGSGIVNAPGLNNYPAPIFFEDGTGQMHAISYGHNAALPSHEPKDLPAGIAVWPNPVAAGQMLQLQAPAGTSLLKITDMAGKTVLVWQKPSGQTPVDSSKLSPGIYLLSAAGGFGLLTVKFAVE